MHAIIKMGDGKYYISSVFGYYNDVKSEGDYQRYLERIHTPYYVVFNEEKTKLIKWYNMQPSSSFIVHPLSSESMIRTCFIKNSVSGCILYH